MDSTAYTSGLSGTPILVIRLISSLLGGFGCKKDHIISSYCPRARILYLWSLPLSLSKSLYHLTCTNFFKALKITSTISSTLKVHFRMRMKPRVSMMNISMYPNEWLFSHEQVFSSE